MNTKFIYPIEYYNNILPPQEHIDRISVYLDSTKHPTAFACYWLLYYTARGLQHFSFDYRFSLKYHSSWATGVPRLRSLFDKIGLKTIVVPSPTYISVNNDGLYASVGCDNFRDKFCNVIFCDDSFFFFEVLVDAHLNLTFELDKFDCNGKLPPQSYSFDVGSAKYDYWTDTEERVTQLLLLFQKFIKKKHRATIGAKDIKNIGIKDFFIDVNQPKSYNEYIFRDLRFVFNLPELQNDRLSTAQEILREWKSTSPVLPRVYGLAGRHYRPLLHHPPTLAEINHPL